MVMINSGVLSRNLQSSHSTILYGGSREPPPVMNKVVELSFDAKPAKRPGDNYRELTPTADSLAPYRKRGRRFQNGPIGSYTGKRSPI